MKFSRETAQPAKSKTDALIVGVYANESIKEVLKEVDSSLSGKLADSAETHAQEEGFKGKRLEFLSMPAFGNIAANRLIFIGLGESAKPSNFRKAAASLYRRLTKQGESKSFTLYLRGKKAAGGKKKRKAKSDTAFNEKDCLTALVEGWILGSFDFDKYKTRDNGTEPGSGSSKKKKGKHFLDLKITGLSLSAADFSKAVEVGQSIGESTNLARTLVAEPAAYMTPSRLASEAKRISKETGMTCTVLNEAQIKKLGMGSFLGVAQGADEPPRFIVIKYTAPKAKKTIALVGKGITFDSGGLSLKNALGMERMKYDMSGAAAVIGTMQVVGQLKPKVNVMGVVAATENMPSGKAMRPGDVITAMNGKTIEVNNTDAEVRLVLADALVYAVQKGADEVIDLATLTGAIIQALGRTAAGIMGTNDELINNLIKSADDAGEKLWRMPLFEEFKPKLKSDIADLKNAGSRGEAGSCCAAMFLKEFVGKGVPWAHMDIAGVAWSDKDNGEVNKGGTGFGVRTLSKYLLS